MKVVTLAIDERTPNGTGTARRARRAGRLPAVVYGENRAPAHVSLDMHDFVVALDHGARVIDLQNAGEMERVLLRDVQYDALGARVVHADFLRVNPDKPLSLRVPMEFTGVPVGISEGGILSVAHRAIEVSCLPSLIPESVPVDVSGLKLGDSLMAESVQLPENVALSDPPDTVLVTVLVPRGIGSEDEEEAEEGEAAEGEEGADGAAAPAES